MKISRNISNFLHFFSSFKFKKKHIGLRWICEIIKNDANNKTDCQQNHPNQFEMDLISLQITNFLLIPKDFCNFTINFRNLIKYIIKRPKFIDDPTNGKHGKYTQIHEQIVACRKMGEIKSVWFQMK